MEKEKLYGAILGPFDQVPFSEAFCISPLNTVSKKKSLERRVILDLSFPEGSSINEGISKDFYLGSKIDLTFPRVDDLVDLIKLKGKHCHLYKRDLKRAYRQIPIDLSDVPLLGYCFEGRYYLFCCLYLPEGNKCNPFHVPNVTYSNSELPGNKRFSNC